jgi:hypothetical protein
MTRRKDFITVEGCFRDDLMMAEVPTKAEYDDFRQRSNAVVERLDKKVHELEDRIAKLETKKMPPSPNPRSSLDEISAEISILEHELKHNRQEINDLFFRRKPYYVSPSPVIRNTGAALLFVKRAFDLAGWNSSELNFTVERRHNGRFIVTITAI